MARHLVTTDSSSLKNRYLAIVSVLWRNVRDKMSGIRVLLSFHSSDAHYLLKKVVFV